MRRVFFLIWCLLALSIPAAATATDRYFGQGGIEGQPEFPIHAELNVEGDRVSGTFTIPGSVFRIDARLTAPGTISGSIASDGAEGTVDLRISPEALSGSFVLGGAPGALRLARTERSADEALGPPPQSSALSTAQWLEDLDTLISILRERHGAPFHRISEGEFVRETSRVRAALPNLNGPRIAVEFRRLAALIGDGHTGVSLFSAQPRYPFRLWQFDDGLRIVETDAAHRSLLGARLLRIGDISSERLLRGLRAYSARGENEAYFQSLVPVLINRPEVLSALGLPEGAPLRWQFQPERGPRLSVTASPVRLAADDWLHLGGRPPLWARSKSDAMHIEYWPDSRSLYANFRRYDELAANSAALGRELDARRPERLILDLRDNGGGDYERGRALLIPEIVNRPWINARTRLFVLIGRDTFSAAMATAADFRSMTHATLVGEAIGEKPNSWQESRRFYLPNSGLPVNVSTRFYSFAPGSPDSIEPDLSAPPGRIEWSRGEDRAINAILATRSARRAVH